MSQRISPPRVFPEASHAAKPPAGSAGALDSYRQAQFVLGEELDLVLEGLRFEGQVAAASSATKYRTQRLMAFMGAWSRAWLCRLQALHAIEWGNHAAAVALVRAAADCQAAALALLRDPSEWEAWLADGGIALAPAQHATEFRLHAFRSAETLAAHATLGPIYRMATDLALPHFGATVLLAASESDPSKVAMTFGDRDFHLGLAELTLGWLELLGAAQLEDIAAAGESFAVDAAAAGALAARLRTAAARSDRCAIELADVAGTQRSIVRNWRRAPGGAPKRILL